MKVKYRDVIMSQETGEVLETKERVVHEDMRPDHEDSFFKVYEDAVEKYKIPAILFPLGFVIGKYIKYVNSENEYMKFKPYGSDRDKLKEMLEISEASLKRILKIATDYGLLFKTDTKCEFIVNPYIICKGHWTYLCKQRKHFYYDEENNKWFMYE